MIYTLTFNPSLDYIIQVDHFKEGIIHKTKQEHIFPGGKGINVAIVLNHLHQNAKALGFVAGYTGQNIIHLLNQQQIPCDFIEVKNGLSRINIKMKSQDIETEINGQGPDITNEDLNLLWKQLDKLQKNDYLIISGSIPSSLPNDLYEQILKRYSDKDFKIIVDATNQLLLNSLKYHPFLIKPNHHELGEIFQTTIKTKQDAIKYAKQLQNLGAINVLVSMASEGAILIDEYHQIHEANAISGHVINSVGAGDSMIAGFLYGYLNYHNYEDALLYGIASGCASAFSSELASKNQVDHYYDQLKNK